MAGCCGPDAARTVPSQGSATRAPGPARGAGNSLIEATGAHGLIAITGGQVQIGAQDSEGFESDGEGPSRIVTLRPYRISATTVSNAQFARFVDSTSYQTEAERAGQSFVFYLQLAPDARARIRQVVAGLPWWLIVPGACWHAPLGPGSDWRSASDHPVVHVSWHDAKAYCEWAGLSLPTEAQWEHAARGGQRGQRYPWGDEFEPEGETRCNTWRGEFPNAPVDAWTPGTVAVDRFPPNGLGLYNTSGNVWEWCADWFNTDYHRATAAADPFDERPSGRRSQRGGSFLCHVSYCNRYRTSARGANSPSSSTSHTGFRVVAN